MDNDGTRHGYYCQRCGKNIIGEERWAKRLACLDTTITKQEYCIDRPQHSPVFQDNPDIKRKTGWTEPFLVGTTRPILGGKHRQPGQDFITWQNDHQNG